MPSEESPNRRSSDGIVRRNITRRNVIRTAGIGGAAALAGCADSIGGGSGGGDSEIKTGQEAYSGQDMTGLLKNGYEEAIMLEHHQDFEEQTGVNVDFEQYSESETRQKFVLAANNQSDAYNLGVVQFWYYPEYQSNDWMEPLDTYLEEYQADWLNFQWDAIYDSVKKPFTTDGTVYGVPHSLITGMLWYREDVFEQLGIDEPETVGDVKQAAQTISESNEVDMEGIIGRCAPAFAAFNTWAGWAWAYGAKTLDDDGNVTIDSEEFRNAFTDLVEMFRDYGPDGLASSNFPELQPYMVEGDAAMHWGTSAWGSIYTNTDIGDNLKATLITGPADNTAQWFYGESLIIPSWVATEKKGSAWQFMQWRQSEDVVLEELESLNRYDNPNRLVLDSDRYEEITQNEGLGDFAEVLQESFERMNDEYWPYVQQFTEVGNTFMQEASSAVAGDQSADEAVSNAQSRVADVLEGSGN